MIIISGNINPKNTYTKNKHILKVAVCTWNKLRHTYY